MSRNRLQLPSDKTIFRGEMYEIGDSIVLSCSLANGSIEQRERLLNTSRKGMQVTAERVVDFQNRGGWLGKIFEGLDGSGPVDIAIPRP